MKKFERFSTQNPIAFGFILIVLFTLLSTLTWPITQIYTSPEGYEVGTAFTKLVIAACFIVLLWGFGWLRTAGYAFFGNKQVWLFVIPMIVYKIIFGIYAFTGSFQFSLPSLGLTFAVIFFAFTTSLVEETMYRGLLLTAMVKAWGSTRRGLFTAAFLSGFFWASLHFFNLLIRPFPVVALQVFGIMMVGFVYAAIVLSSGSIWPTIVFHWVINASVSLQAIQNPNFEETITAWTIFGLVVLPLVTVGFYLMFKVALPITLDSEEIHFDKQLETIHT